MATRNEVIKILTIIEVAYPAMFQNMAENKLKAMVSLWTEMFQDTDPDELSYAVKSYIANNTSGFPPSIGQINNAIKSIHDDGITEIEAWSMVKTAMQRVSDIESAQRQWEQLPESVRAPIKPKDLLEWGFQESDTVNMVISSAYRKSYNAKREKAQSTLALPQSVKKLIELKKIDD